MVQRKYWPLLGAVAGTVLGASDYLLFWLIDVTMRVDGADITWLIVTFYAINFAAVGWLSGRTHAQRAEIRAHLDSLSAAQAREAELAKLATIGRLAAGVAHEVRNPLAVIKSSTALLAEEIDPANADAQTVAGFIDAEIDRLDTFIGALLAYARPQTLALRAEPLTTLIEQICPIAAAETGRRGIELTIEVGTVEAVQIDIEALAQMIFSLVVNACEAPNVTHVSVRAAGTRIEVADDGSGIAPEDRPHLFEPFFTTKAKGTGLGLAMAARVVEGHGGSIEVVDGAGAGPDRQGACFRVQLGPA